ncbi:MAG: FMN-binding negative transcriptional regulator [Alicyclobacillus sp.]|nr:FMN-binding negative transcriptional regulator [Alicyclobacillus sp.]
MYIPKLYRLDRDEAVQIMKWYPFAILVTVDRGTPIATHIPVEIREAGDKIFALGHIAYGNAQKHTIPHNDKVLLIFQGPHTYISSSWYEAENVPTWDYVAVHAYGTSRVISGHELEDHLSALLERYESNRPNGRRWDTLSCELLQGQMKGIVAFQIEITAIEGSAKLSQNRNDRDYKTIVGKLEESGEENARHVAEWMRGRRPHLF